MTISRHSRMAGTRGKKDNPSAHASISRTSNIISKSQQLYNNIWCSTHLFSGWLEAYLILCKIKRHWCLLTESAKVLFLNSSSSFVSNCPARGLRDPNLWADIRTAWTSWSLFDVFADESTLKRTLWIFDMMMFKGSSGSSARSGSKPSKSMCSAIAQIRRANILGVFTCQMHKCISSKGNLAEDIDINFTKSENIVAKGKSG